MYGVELLEAVENVENLPTLPVIVQQIEYLMANQNSNMAQIAAVIARDQAISSRVIRLVNSAFYGFPNRVSSIQQAITLLGLNTIKNLVMGVSIVKSFEQSDPSSAFDRSRLWIHSFGCAMAAQDIARHLHRPQPSDYFLAGLLHDMGILVLDQFMHEEFDAILRYCTEKDADYYDAEKLVLGVTHADIGVVLARKWRLADYLLNSIRYHHEPAFNVKELESCIDIIAAVHVADVLIWNKGIDLGIGNKRHNFLPRALKHLGIPDPVLNDIGGMVFKEVNAVANEWGIRAATAPPVNVHQHAAAAAEGM